MKGKTVINKITIVIVLLLAVGAVITIKEKNRYASESKAVENPVGNVIAKEKRVVETDKAEESN